MVTSGSFSSPSKEMTLKVAVVSFSLRVIVLFGSTRQRGRMSPLTVAAMASPSSVRKKKVFWKGPSKMLLSKMKVACIDSPGARCCFSKTKSAQAQVRMTSRMTTVRSVGFFTVTKAVGFSPCRTWPKSVTSGESTNCANPIVGNKAKSSICVFITVPSSLDNIQSRVQWRGASGDWGLRP